MIRLQANGVSLTCTASQTLTSGAQKIYRCEFSFTQAWDGLSRTAVFRAGSVSKSVLLGDDDQCDIPWEVLAHPGADLYAGVCGTNASGTVMPTTWAKIRAIQPGTKPAEMTQEPPTDVYAQILAVAIDAQTKANEVVDRANAGEFEGPPGGYYSPVVTQQSSTSMTVSFVPSQPDMPAVQDVTVELPGRGVEPEKELELIFDEVIFSEEDTLTNSIYVSIPPCIELYTELTIPPVDVGRENGTLKFQQDGTTCISIKCGIATSTKYTTICRCHLFKIYDWWEHSTEVDYNYWASKNFGIADTNFSDDSRRLAPINRINYFTGSSGCDFSVGTSLKVWGVRA